MSYHLLDSTEEFAAVDGGISENQFGQKFGEGAVGAPSELRIEETIGRTWSGVSGCGDQSRIQAEFQACYNGWVQQKIYEHLNWKVLEHGHGQFDVRTSSSREPWPSNARHCRGSMSGRVYIVFEQPSAA